MEAFRLRGTRADREASATQALPAAGLRVVGELFLREVVLGIGMLISMAGTLLMGTTIGLGMDMV